MKIHVNISLSLVMLFIGSVAAVAAKKEDAGESRTITDSLVRSMKFQFEPITLHGQANGVWIPTNHTENTKLPLWLMINMNGPMRFDTTQYKLNQVELNDKTWLVNATLNDSLSSKFELQFIIEGSGKSLLKLTDAAGEKQLYEGYIYPYERTFSFAKEKAMERALQTERIIDSIVPALTFQVNYSMGRAYYSVIESYKMYRSTMPNDLPVIEGNRVLMTPKILKNQFAKVRYLDKVNDNWYIRVEYMAERQPLTKRSYVDYCINAFTGETYIRSGYYDRLPANWRHYKDRAGFTNPA